MPRLAKQLFYLVTLPAALVALWWVLSVSMPSLFVPTPPALFEALIETWIGPRLLADLAPSMLRYVIGVAIALGLGVGLGIWFGLNKTVRDVVEPLLEFLRALPAPMIIPVLIVVIGVNDSMKIFIIAFGAIWPVLLNTIEGVRAADEVQSDTSRSYGITGMQRVRFQILPSAAPQIFAGIRQSLPIALILVVISEMFASTSGLGFAIIQAQRQFAIPEMWAGIVVLGLVGYLISVIFRFAEKRVLSWYIGLKDSENAD